MFKKIFAIVMALTFFAATASMASVIDAPHDDSSGVTCSSCHSYSLWWRYSPINQSITPSKSTIVNDVCNKCHDGSKAQIPTQRTHSSTVIGSSLHDVWEIACVDCHDPHFQGQLDWVATNLSYPAGLYLVKGTIGAVAIGTVANTTNLSYNNIPADILSGWNDRSRWGKKNVNPNFDRGLILVVGTDRVKNTTYQVISADNSVITVKGTVDPVETGRPFGLIYGQLIRKVISTPSSGDRQVTFFDPDTLYGQGGFTDQQTPRQGICQVCHTETSHWTQDALNDGHNATLKCTHCHGAAQGFKPVLPSHDFLIDTSPCTNCHQHLANNPLAIHGNTCQTCHSNPPLLRTDSGNFLYVTRVGLDPAGPALGNGTATACTYCHSDYFGGHAYSHTMSVTVNTAITPVTANCIGCHSALVSPFTGLGEAHAVNGCATCHDLATNGGLKGSAASATAPYGECIMCHSGYFASHDHGTSGGSRSHIVSLGADTYSGQSCADCHNNSNGNLVAWNDILVEHQSDCGFCHNSSRTADVSSPYTSVADVIRNDAQHSVITCLDCHLSHTNYHQTRYVSAYEDGGEPSPVILTTCAVNCHSPIFSTSAADPKRHDTCRTCHTATATPVTLIGSAIGKTVPDDDPLAFNNCYTCHGTDYFSRHTNVNHSSAVSATTDNTCERCHNTGDPLTIIHHNDCGLCHDQARGGVLISLAVNGSGNCNTCHGSNWLTIHATTNRINHSLTVAMATVCSACHAGTAGTATGIPVDPLNNTIHDSCATCHGAQGQLVGVGSGHGGGADCQSCHGSFGVGAHSAVNHADRVAMSLACSSCHTGANGTATGIPVDSANPKHHGACASCHGSTGALSGSASGKTGNNDCESCHGLFAVKHAGQDHSLTVSMATDCSGCHTATGNTVDPNDPKVHDACTACHAADGSLAGSASGHTGGGSCNVCHGSFATRHAARDHSAFVSLSTDCSGCHSGTEGTATGMPVGGSNKKHAVCAQCHGGTGVLVSIAAGNGGGAECDTCHGLFAVKHRSEDHSFRVALAADCADCHTGTEGNISGVPINTTSTENKKHDGCFDCHDATGVLTGSAAGKEGASSATPNDCKTCHGDFIDHHAAVDHSSMVRMDKNDHCSGCHTATGSTVNPNDPRVHDACTSCHDANGRLVGAAAGKDGGTLGGTNGGGDCIICHGEYLPNHQSINPQSSNHNLRSISFGSGMTCSGCHTSDTSVLGTAGTGSLLSQNDVNKLHSRPTGDACSLCHYYNLTTQANAQGLPLWNTVRNAIVNGTNGAADATCVVCHDYNQTSTGHWSHGTNRAPAFNPATFIKPNAAKDITYSGQTIAGSAIDPDADAITYSKISGPAWLTVAADGSLGGTPTVAATDNFVVGATATGGTGYATLTVTVVTSGNQAPTFTSLTVSKANATVGLDYSDNGQTLAGSAIDPEGDAIIYAKMNGPAWLTVAADGTLSGTPTAAGNDSFVVRATATGGTGEATLDIMVVNQPPVFSSSPFSKPNAIVGFVYSGQTIAGSAMDPNGGAITYSKVSGPAWLTITPDGYLSGTPTTAASDSFVVRATTAGGRSDATLNIVVVATEMAQLNPWTNIFSSAPELPAIILSPFNAGNISVGSGLQRLLLVSVIMEHASVESPTVGATYNGKTLVPIAFSTNQKENVWMGYLVDSQIGTTGSKPLLVSYTGAVRGMDVKWTSFVGVNQTTPVCSAAANSAAATTVSFGSNINYVNNGMTVVVAGNGGHFSGTLNATPAFTAGSVTLSSLQASMPFTTATHTLSGTYPAATLVSWTGTTAWSALVVVSLQP